MQEKAILIIPRGLLSVVLKLQTINKYKNIITTVGKVLLVIFHLRIYITVTTQRKLEHKNLFGWRGFKKKPNILWQECTRK